jgi:transcriptional regulator with XRE-family HTH domain
METKVTVYVSWMDLGARMKQVRLRAGWTQQQTADRLACTKAAVSNFENGQNKPSIETLIAFATETGTSLDWLLLGREPQGVYDKRLRDLSDALREYVINALVLAERVQLSTPGRFLRPPTSDQYLEFSQYLTRLSDEMSEK